MKSGDLGKASDLLDALKAVDGFIRGNAAWNGAIQLSFGSYECRIWQSAAALRNITDALWIERDKLIGMLAELGVTYDPPPP